MRGVQSGLVRLHRGRHVVGLHPMRRRPLSLHSPGQLLRRRVPPVRARLHGSAAGLCAVQPLRKFFSTHAAFHRSRDRAINQLNRATIPSPPPLMSPQIPGYFSSDGLQCRACPPGKYAVAGGAGGEDLACAPCHAGRFADGSASLICKDCYAGTYSDTAGNSICLACPAGKYSNDVAAASPDNCYPCDAGTFGPSSGATSAGCVSICAKNRSRAQQNSHAKTTLTYALRVQLYCVQTWDFRGLGGAERLKNRVRSLRFGQRGEHLRRHRVCDVLRGLVRGARRHALFPVPRGFFCVGGGQRRRDARQFFCRLPSVRARLLFRLCGLPQLRPVRPRFFCGGAERLAVRALP